MHGTSDALLLCSATEASSGVAVARTLRACNATPGAYPKYVLTGTISGAQTVHAWADIPALCSITGTTHVVFAIRARPALMRELAELAVANALTCSLVVARAGDESADHDDSHVSRFDALTVHIDDGLNKSYRGIGRKSEIAAACCLLVTCAPIIALAALAVMLDSAGPAFFRQSRLGQNGRTFRIWKLRTLCTEALPYQPSPGDSDPTVTGVGRLLRATGLDELPQLLNVFRGEMSLVGPRPEMPFIAEQYTSMQRERLAVRPGITGLWQLYGARALPMHDQIEYDFYYIAFRSLGLDLRLLGATISFAFRGFFRALVSRPEAERSRSSVPFSRAISPSDLKDE